ncbi:MAG: gluconeogenesis factor YvcK family protein [Chloroflexota bacterium]
MQLTRGLSSFGAWVDDLAKWSRPGMHVKRWLVLLVLGLTAVALGIAFFLVQIYRTQPFPEWVRYVTLQPIDRPWRGALFLTIGIGVIALAIVQLNRSLMTAVQPPYVSDGSRLVDVVYNYRLPQRRPQVVTLAGHRGFVALQQHRDHYATKLLGLASVADGPLPPDLAAQLPGAGSDRLLFPVDEPLELCAELEHGTILRGADAIRTRRSGVPIKRVFLIRSGDDPEQVLREDTSFLRSIDVPVRAETLYAIREADVILFGPGSLYLSILPNLLVRELDAAIQTSKARKILITSLMTEPGQTDHFGAADFVRALHAYGGFKLDYVLVNSATTDPLIQERYSAALATPVVPDMDAGRDGTLVAAGRRLRKLSTAEGAVIVSADLATRMVERIPVPAGEGDGGTATQSIVVFRHDPEKLAGALAVLLGVTATPA